MSNKLDTLRARLGEVRDEMRAIADMDADELTDEHESRYQELEVELESEDDGVTRGLLADIDREERRQTLLAKANEMSERKFDAPPAVHVKHNPTEVLSRQGATEGDVRDAAMRVIEERVARPEWQESAERHARRGRSFAEHIVRYSDPLYERAWAKMLSGQTHLMDADEQRALAVGTNTQGGAMVPTHLDPTILLSNDGTVNPYRGISRVVTLGQADGNTWNGVSSAGATASWDDEEEEVSDDSPELAAPSIPVYKGQAFVAASFEAFQDISGLAEDVVMVLRDAKDRLEAAAFTTGSGSGAPTGIFTALDANTNAEVAVTTQGSIGAADIYKVYEAVPPRFRSQSTWVTNLKYINAIRQFGTDDPNFTVDMTAAGIPQLFGRRIVESSDAPTVAATTTGVQNRLVIGDFSNYVIVDKLGMSVDFIPQLFGTTNGLPTGQRGWLAYWRTGADSVIDTAFRLLQDHTTA